MASRSRRRRTTRASERRAFVGGRRVPRLVNPEERARRERRSAAPHDDTKQIIPRGGKMFFDPKTGKTYYLPPTPSDMEKTEKEPESVTAPKPEPRKEEPPQPTPRASFDAPKDMERQVYKKGEASIRGVNPVPRLKLPSPAATPTSTGRGPSSTTPLIPPDITRKQVIGSAQLRGTLAASAARGRALRIPSSKQGMHLLIESLEERELADINPSIDYRYASDVSRETKDNGTRLIQQHGDCVEMWTWLPNACKHHSRQPPSGFVVAMSANKETPLVRDLFFPFKFHYGTLAVRVPQHVVTKEGKTAVDVLRATRPNELQNVLIQDDVVPSALIRPGSGSYAGIYISQDREDDDASTASLATGESSTLGSGGSPWKSWVWIVVQMGNPSISQDIYKKIEASEMKYKRFRRAVIEHKRREAVSQGYKPSSVDETTICFDEEVDDQGNPCPEEPTWENYFFTGTNKVEFGNQLDAIEETRFEVAMNIASKVLGLQTESTRKMRHEWLHVSTVCNTVSTISDGVHVYYSGCTQIHQSTRAVVVNESPIKGPVILRGPPTPGNVLGNPWPAAKSYGITKEEERIDQMYSQRPYMAFPCITGRVLQIDDVRDAEKSTGAGLEPFVFRGMETRDELRTHPRLHPKLYRKRGHAWKSLERYMGYDPLWGEIQLRPMAVLIAPPPERDVFGGISL
jgi:hypothetical protein